MTEARQTRIGGAAELTCATPELSEVMLELAKAPDEMPAP